MSTRNNQPDNRSVPVDQEIRGGCIAIGNFDGVHRGHQSMLKHLRALARRHHTHTVAITFHPHPVAVLRPEQTPPVLTTIQDRMELLRMFGADSVEVLPVTPQLLNMTAAAFFHEFILGRYEAVGLVEGENFRFGRDRQGDIGLLRQLCEQHAVALEVVDLLGAAGGTDTLEPPNAPGSSFDSAGEISSSRIRDLIAHGKLTQAIRLLGHPYRICGRVTTGAGRGRELGFPTANLSEVQVLLPGHGVYAAVTQLNGSQHTVAVHVGPNPTFSESFSKVECHVLDFQGDLYGHALAVDILGEIRPLARFASRVELMDQIQRDLQVCRELTSKT